MPTKKKRKKSLVGWINKKEPLAYWMSGRFDCYYLETNITKHKFNVDDIKVRITIEEL